MRVLILVLIFVAAVWAFQQSRTSGGSEILTELVGGPSRLTTTNGPVMVDDTLEGYRKWSRNPEHFGAFAVSEFGDYGHVRGFNELAAAEVIALAYCDQPGCRIVARMVPMTRSEDADVLVVSQRTFEVFEDYIALGGIKAMAILSLIHI